MRGASVLDSGTAGIPAAREARRRASWSVRYSLIVRGTASDRKLVQMVCGSRPDLPAVRINLSTREPSWLWEALVPLGVKAMPAGWQAEPGGHANESDAEREFEIAYTRSSADVASFLRSLGYDPVRKDWQRA